MAIQIILCLECDKRSSSDYIYVKETIDRFYEYGNEVKISPVHLGGKYRYCHKDTIKEINKKITEFRIGETKIFFITDTDDYEKRQEDKRYLEEITEFCKKNGYEHIWFCHNIEEVYLGDRNCKDKVKQSGEFRRKRQIYKTGENILESNAIKKGYSNILSVFDKYMQRKNRRDI